MRTHHPARGGNLPASLCITLTTLLCACTAQDDAADEANDDGSSSVAATDDESTADDGSTTADPAACVDEAGDAGLPADALEIEGDWVDDFGGNHAITAESWSQTGEFNFAYTIATYDNATDTVIAQDDGDSTWSKFQWSEATDGSVFYCQIAYGEACRADAEAAPNADATDPMTSGCGMFPWSHLVPAR